MSVPYGTSLSSAQLQTWRACLSFAVVVWATNLIGCRNAAEPTPQAPPASTEPSPAPPPKPAFSDAWQVEDVLRVTRAVADWQLQHPYTEKKEWDWTNGALWTGLMAHSHTTGDEKYVDALRGISERLQYNLGPRSGHADDHVVGQLHLWHYLRDELPKQLEPTRKVMEAFVVRPHEESLRFENKIAEREWAWCDALYMAPPTLAALYTATGDQRFLDSADTLWWKTTDYLYDKASSLYFRDSRYFDKKEANGAKVFWSRGNGWVFAGIAHMLQHMPADYPARPKYIALFQEMAAKLKSIQQPDGSWHASLLDPENFAGPESSGTAFFTYGFLWGMNSGILSEDEFREPAQKGWKRLVANVHANGMLGYVQRIDDDPHTQTFDETAPYGVGGFLQAGHELHKRLILQQSKLSEITATNPSPEVRLNEILQVPWTLVTSKLGSVKADSIAVRDTVRGYFAPTQVVDENQDGQPDALLFRTDLTPNEVRRFQLCALKGSKPLFAPARMTARFVPERKDDFAWENDRVAFRAYGPALAAEDARGGVDVWTKSVRVPIVDRWYKSGEYHADHGTGLDGYKVGASLGCGGLGYLAPNGKLVTSPVFAKSRVLEHGPLRLKFELSYAPVKVGRASIRETRTVTMLSGSHAFTVHSHFDVEGNARGIRPVAGLVLRESKLHTVAANGFMGYWDDIMAKDHGHIGTFVLTKNAAMQPRRHKSGHLLAALAKDLSKPVQYAAGALWQPVEGLEQAAFERRLAQLHARASHPSKVQ